MDLLLALLGCLIQAGWALRLHRSGLAKWYPVLFGYLAFTAFCTFVGVVFFQVAGDGPVYSWYWVVLQPFLWAASLGVVLEMYQRLLSGYRGLESLGRFALYGALTVAFLVSALAVLYPAGTQSWRAFWAVQERNLYAGLTVLCLLLFQFARFIGLPLARNLRVLFAVFGLTFATQALSWAAASLPVLGGYAATAACVVSLGCLLAGTLTFSPAGESRPRTSAPCQRPVQRLARLRLSTFNRRLLALLHSFHPVTGGLS